MKSIRKENYSCHRLFQILQFLELCMQSCLQFYNLSSSSGKTKWQQRKDLSLGHNFILSREKTFQFVEGDSLEISWYFLVAFRLDREWFMRCVNASLDCHSSVVTSYRLHCRRFKAPEPSWLIIHPLQAPKLVNQTSESHFVTGSSTCPMWGTISVLFLIDVETISAKVVFFGGIGFVFSPFFHVHGLLLLDVLNKRFVPLSSAVNSLTSCKEWDPKESYSCSFLQNFPTCPHHSEKTKWHQLNKARRSSLWQSEKFCPTRSLLLAH